MAICVGQPTAFRADESSAIAKQPCVGPVSVARAGLAGDAQADLAHHGGPDMALHQYPLDHHEYWRTRLGDHPLLALPGAFGSNLAIAGLAEGDVLLGDRFRLGTALVEACQPRQPCWKIEHRFGAKGMVKAILETGRCGWFYRVLEAGEAQAGDSLVLEKRGLAGWSMARLFAAIWGTASPWDPVLIGEIAALPGLPVTLSRQLQARLAAR